jgi:putative transposase
MMLPCSKKEEKLMDSTRLKRAYPSDLTDRQWEILQSLIPPLKADAAYHLHERREMVNAILYVLRSGWTFRSLPHDLPAWGTVYDSFRKWRRDGVWDRVLEALRMQMRVKEGRDAQPSAGIIDSQSIKTSAVRGPEKGDDAGKKNLGAQTTRTRREPGPSVGRQRDGSGVLRLGGRLELAVATQRAVSQDEAALGR